MDISSRLGEALRRTEAGGKEEIVHWDDVTVEIHGQQTAQRCFPGSAVAVDGKNKRGILPKGRIQSADQL